MRDFEQRVDVVEVYLPEPEDLDLFWVKGRQRNTYPGPPKEEEVIAALCPQTTPVTVVTALFVIVRGI